MAKTYRYRKNIWEDGPKSKKHKGPQKVTGKKRYTTNEILDRKLDNELW